MKNRRSESVTGLAVQGASASVSVYDARPFFEKALHYGVQHGIIDSPKLALIGAEAPKGMVQIARYFGSEFLRPEIEKARDRLVNLVSLYLEASCEGDLRRAAESLRDHSFLSRSKGGSDMLKALIAMPQNSHFGMNESGGFTDEHIPLLAKWSLRSLADYQAELSQRSQVAQVMDAAIWLAARLGMDAADLEEAGKDAEAVIRTALLVLATGRRDMPDWVAFEKTITALRKKHGTTAAPDKGKVKGAGRVAIAGPVSIFTLPLPKQIPESLVPVIEAVRVSVLEDMPKIVDPALAPRQLFDQTPAFMGRYFWVEDSLSEVDHHDRLTSGAWAKATGGLSDDGSLLTLFLSIAAGAPPKTLLTEKAAVTLVRKIQKSGLQVDLVYQYIAANAPAQYQQDYASLWSAFVEESQQTLQSDSFSALEDAVALLRLECNVR
jgi:hypothetical protein